MARNAADENIYITYTYMLTYNMSYIKYIYNIYIYSSAAFLAITVSSISNILTHFYTDKHYLILAFL